ncbi:hypothetical protein GYO_0421 [Bacillus spizizenii TU-B-10]|uniref:Uncharacterized protein n=1 Tax=Bacillus spizizenii (strain DSM 15029 / JCM 12233 / NBRC 101239 / NRRL B-23049 / TU-B-10) TaxID=1052585 RepID=G4NQQ3_BACS4|nr:hypothetical protein GYO_0421 [Bacillus spizizenii TU-B-10]
MEIHVEEHIVIISGYGHVGSLVMFDEVFFVSRCRYGN